MKKLKDNMEEYNLTISQWIEDVEVKYNPSGSVTLINGDDSVTLEEESVQQFVDFINIIKTK